MARIRSVHPGIWTDEAFITVSPNARLLFIGIWNECDDQGAFRWNPVTLKVRLAPMDAVHIPDLLGELVSVNLVRNYTHNSVQYGVVRNFREWQRPKKPNYIYPMTDDLRIYAGMKADGSEPDDDEDGSGGEPTPLNGGSGSPPRTASGEPRIHSTTRSPPPGDVSGELDLHKPSPIPPDIDLAGEKSPQEGKGREGRRREGKEDSSKIQKTGGLDARERANDPRGQRLPEDWNPGPEGGRFARELGLDPARVFDKFRDYWTAKPGKDGRKTDWQSVWRNWCRNEMGHGRGLNLISGAKSTMSGAIP